MVGRAAFPRCSSLCPAFGAALLVLTSLFSSSVSATGPSAKVVIPTDAMGRVLSVAMSPDGKRAVSGSWDGSVRIWDLETGENTAALKGHTLWVSSVAFSPQGDMVLTGSGDKTARLWNLATGQETVVFEGHAGFVNAVAWSWDGRLAASASQDGTINIWDINRRSKKKTLLGHGGPVHSVAFSPDGALLFSGGEDGTARLWKLDSDKDVKVLKTGPAWVASVTFTADGKKSVFGTGNGSIHVAEVKTGRIVKSIATDTQGVTSLAAYPANDTLFGAHDATARLWDISKGKEVSRLIGHKSTVTAVAMSRDGKTALTGSADETLKLWDLTNGREIRTLKDSRDRLLAVAVSLDGSHVVTGGELSAVNLWNLAQGSMEKDFKGHSDAITALAFSPGGQQVLSGSRDGTARIWSIATGQTKQTFRGHKGWISSVAMSRDARFVLSGSLDRTAKLWDAETGREVASLDGHTDGVLSVAFGPQNDWAVTGGKDGTLRTWSLPAGGPLKTIEGHKAAIASVAISPDSKSIASGDENGIVKLWDASTAKELISAKACDGPVKTVAFGRKSGEAQTVCENAAVQRLELTTGKKAESAGGERLRIQAAAFFPTGDRVVTASRDGTTRLSDVLAGSEVGRFAAFSDGHWAVLTPGGYYNVSPGGEKQLRIRAGEEVFEIGNRHEQHFKPSLVASAIGKGVAPATSLESPASEVPLIFVDETKLAAAVRGSSTTIVGRATGKHGIAVVTVNGVEAALDADGNFKADVLLKPGPNECEIAATDVRRNEARRKLSPIVRSFDEVSASSQPEYSATVMSRLRGNYHALVIGINDYKHLNKLKTAVNDAKEVAKLLEESFGFKTTLLLEKDATRDKIIDELDRLREQLGATDRLLVYYAGHGWHETKSNEAFWQPIDADKVRVTKWIPSTDITAMLKRMAVRHALVVSDSCYSGRMSRGSGDGELPVKEQRENYLKRMVGKDSRLLLSSGGNEPVDDEGGKGHSVFADTFLEALRTMDDPVFTVNELFVKGRVRESVAGRALQTPELNPIRDSGHDGGDFVFLRQLPKRTSE